MKNFRSTALRHLDVNQPTKHKVRNVLCSASVGGSLLALAAASSAFAAGQDAAKLGTQLTPSGAEVASSGDGAIPQWSAPGAQGSGWSSGKLRLDHWKHKTDKPVYSIDASNAQKYADKLAPGQLALLKSIKDFRMDVYPTRRSCGVPDFVAENTKKNVGFAKLDQSGAFLQDAYVPGFPFPMPASGAEAMWNMKMRYRGLGLEMSKNAVFISPRKGSTEWLKSLADGAYMWPWGEKGSSTFAKADQLEALYYYNYLEPAALAGQSGLAMAKTGAAMEGFAYFPGQRRVRRMPSYAYDAPQIGLDNQLNVDEQNVFSGNIDRFDWKLVGKKELIVPYNSFGAHDIKAKFSDVVLSNAPAPSHRRYELHRVWVVEATVKQGMRHVSPKRTIYLDEDSWAPVMAVDYDGRGQIWKVREGNLIPVYETGTCDVAATTQYNLADGRYLLDAPVTTGTDYRWLTTSNGNPRLKRSFYTADNLRAVSER